jgi:hypothetical protein
MLWPIASFEARELRKDPRRIRARPKNLAQEITAQLTASNARNAGTPSSPIEGRHQKPKECPLMRKGGVIDTVGCKGLRDLSTAKPFPRSWSTPFQALLGSRGPTMTAENEECNVSG